MDILVDGIIEVITVVLGAHGDEIGLAGLDNSGGLSTQQLAALHDVLSKGGDVLGMKLSKTVQNFLDGTVDGDGGDTGVDVDVPLNFGHGIVCQGRLEDSGGFDSSLFD